MNVVRDSVVRFHYDLADESGERLESSRGDEPMAVIQGRGGVVRGLDLALEGRTEGERFQVTVSPEEGFGLRQENWTQRVSKKHFSDPKRLKPGQKALLPTDRGSRSVTVLKVGSKMVDVDLNHPLAGRALTFDVEIVEIREAAREELAHGHVHGPGGHSH